MFKQILEKFKQNKITPLKSQEELTPEFVKSQQEFANLFHSDFYKLLKAYFGTRIEINRDIIEALNIADPANHPKISAAQSENNILRELINDVESINELYDDPEKL